MKLTTRLNILLSPVELFAKASSALPFSEDIGIKLALLDEIPSINSGGCAIVAYALVQHINEVYPELNPEIVYLFDRSDSRARYNIMSNQADSCTHIVICIDNLYYDSTGVYTKKHICQKWKVQTTEVVSKALTLDSINNAGWNPQFQRYKHVRTIGKILNIKKQLLKEVS